MLTNCESQSILHCAYLLSTLSEMIKNVSTLYTHIQPNGHKTVVECCSVCLLFWSHIVSQPVTAEGKEDRKRYLRSLGKDPKPRAYYAHAVNKT